MTFDERRTKYNYVYTCTLLEVSPAFQLQGQQPQVDAYFQDHTSHCYIGELLASSSSPELRATEFNNHTLV